MVIIMRLLALPHRRKGAIPDPLLSIHLPLSPAFPSASSVYDREGFQENIGDEMLTEARLHPCSFGEAVTHSGTGPYNDTAEFESLKLLYIISINSLVHQHGLG